MSRPRFIGNMKTRSSIHRWKKRGSGLVALPVGLFLLGAISFGQKKSVEIRLAEPFTMRDDFQGESLGQWASYPPPQDIGYEPSLSPTADFDAHGGRSLMRVMQPAYPGPLSFGFIKRLRL